MKSEPENSNPPINVAIPNTTQEKMTAIVNLSEAVKELAKTLNGVNVQVTMSNNVVSNIGTGPGISIHTEQ